MSTAEGATASASRSRGRLLCVLGLGFGLAVSVGNTIGAGILRTPGEIAAHFRDPWLFVGVWIVGGVYALIAALSMAELAAMIPRSGGQYVFARRALGDYAGFVVGWGDWISTSATNAAVPIIVGQYLGAIFPALEGEAALTASAAVAALAFLQWRGVRWGSRTQNLTTVLKALGLALVVAACFVRGAPAAPGSTPVAPPQGWDWVVALVLSLQAVIYSYDGWTGPIYFSEEVRDPARNVPRAMLGGLLAVMGLYVLINLALAYLLPISEIAGESFALGRAARVIFGPNGDLIIRVVVILSMLSAINAYHLMGSRVLYSLSRDRLFWAGAARVNPGGTPTVALVLGTVASLLFIWTGTFEDVIAVAVFFFVANYAISFVSLFVLRRREPGLARPVRAWGFPWTTGIALLGSVAFLAGAVAADTGNSLRALLLLAASYPAFRLTRWLVRRPPP